MPIYFVDTNYFLRYLTNDLPKQAEIVENFLDQAAKGELKAQASVTVFFEIYWVLKSFYHQSKQEYLPHLKKVLCLSFIDLENRDILEEAVTLFETTTLELEDCYNLIFARHTGATHFASFDAKAVKAFSKLKS